MKAAPKRRKSAAGPPGKPPAGYTPALTGLRGLAAGLVFLHHFFGQWFWQHEWSSFLCEGYIGVTVFFTLSGYLITRTYLDRFVAGTIGFGEYWFRRFARVYPPYLLLLTVVLMFYRPPSGAGQVLANVTLMQAFFYTHLWSGIAAAWSLTSEECFYLMAPPVFWLFARRKKLVARLAALAILSVTLWFGGQGIVAIKPAGDFLTSDFYMRVYTIFGRFPEFAIGVATALLVVKGPKILSGNKRARRLAVEGATVAFFLSIAGCVGLMLWLRGHYHETYGINTPYGMPALWILSVGTALFIWSGTQGSQLAGWLAGNRAVEYLGRISYIFYLLQERQLADHVLKITGDSPVLAYLGLNCCAAVLYELVEKPVHAALLGLLKRPSFSFSGLRGSSKKTAPGSPRASGRSRAPRPR